jgi:hypothetical protein
MLTIKAVTQAIKTVYESDTVNQFIALFHKAVCSSIKRFLKATRISVTTMSTFDPQHLNNLSRSVGHCGLGYSWSAYQFGDTNIHRGLEAEGKMTCILRAVFNEQVTSS